MVLAAPARRLGEARGQVAEFLAESGAEGLQHLAFAVPDLRAALHRLHGAGLSFVGAAGHDPAEAIIEHRDGERYLRQAFSAPLVGECFVELIERHGIEGLHPGNIQSLYEKNEAARPGRYRRSA